MTSNNPGTREKAKKIAIKEIDAAAVLGVDTVLVVPGAVGVDFIPGCEIVEYDVAYDRASEAIKELSRHAEAKKSLHRYRKCMEQIPAFSPGDAEFYR